MPLIALPIRVVFSHRHGKVPILLVQSVCGWRLTPTFPSAHSYIIRRILRFCQFFSEKSLFSIEPRDFPGCFNRTPRLSGMYQHLVYFNFAKNAASTISANNSRCEAAFAAFAAHAAHAASSHRWITDSAHLRANSRSRGSASIVATIFLRRAATFSTGDPCSINSPSRFT